ncbi:MAG: hypothetical protein IPF70_16415 [Saprospiraceae bacterium]|nr:hypothetical protein [Saprospiraceae bacterium]
MGLSLFHTLFTLEHNAICDELIQHHQGWSDDQLFIPPDSINAALMAKIHTIEWNSAINPILQSIKATTLIGMPSFRLLTMLKHKKDWRTVAPINIRKYRARGRSRQSYQKIWARLWTHGRIRRTYRIHSMLPETLEIRDIHSKSNDGGYSFTLRDILVLQRVCILRSICSLVFKFETYLH